MTAAAAVILGCASHGTLASQAASGGADDSVCADLFDAVLATWQRCPVPILGLGVGGYSGAVVDASEKDDFVTYYCHALAGAPGTENLATQLRACAAALRSDANSCAAAYDPACALRGALPDGTACGASAQCRSGACAIAASPDPNTEFQCGRCASLIGDGGLCGGVDVGVCGPGLFCGGLVTTEAGIETVCTSYARQGEPCPSSCSPQPCTPPQCTPGLACAANGANEVCQPAPAALREGQPCDMSGCAPGLYCAWASGAPAGAAAPTNVCARAPTLGQGQSCEPNSNGFSACDFGLRCQEPNAGPSVCEPIKGVGAACRVHAVECASLLVCAGGICQEPNLSSCPRGAGP